ncbi:ECF RNA polymerase sigma factor SigW [Oxobacter pfennigii]|uniref:ECF RNA polymerase sigma factor SigW n=1 Tax=Oxobacter pfennigii TaxID=36849 RepID=A0A0P8W5W1_9CLOT|nr:sigma-70 family RNA polymerase sigma factor [Oxobacter pfennigii]KPU43081.1 ECF RNA polymerase sigma factor SigW [Oxobacter pfennigii]
MQDESIIKAVLKGHTAGYAILVDRYKNIIFDLCYKYTYDYSEAQDLSQEILLKAYKKLSTFKNSSKFSTWLYRIGVNTCIDWVRKNKKYSGTISIDQDRYIELLPSQNPVPEDIVVDSEKRELLRNAIHSLPEKYKTVIILYNYKNLSCKEISDILGVAVNTVETRLYRGKKLLRDKLLKPCNGGEYLWNAVK